MLRLRTRRRRPDLSGLQRDRCRVRPQGSDDLRQMLWDRRRRGVSLHPCKGAGTRLNAQASVRSGHRRGRWAKRKESSSMAKILDSVTMAQPVRPAGALPNAPSGEGLAAHTIEEVRDAVGEFLKKQPNVRRVDVTKLVQIDPEKRFLGGGSRRLCAQRDDQELGVAGHEGSAGLPDVFTQVRMGNSTSSPTA